MGSPPSPRHCTLEAHRLHRVTIMIPADYTLWSKMVSVLHKVCWYDIKRQFNGSSIHCQVVRRLALLTRFSPSAETSPVGKACAAPPTQGAPAVSTPTSPHICRSASRAGRAQGLLAGGVDTQHVEVLGSTPAGPCMHARPARHPGARRSKPQTGFDGGHSESALRQGPHHRCRGNPAQPRPRRARRRCPRRDRPRPAGERAGRGGLKGCLLGGCATGRTPGKCTPWPLHAC